LVTQNLVTQNLVMQDLVMQDLVMQNLVMQDHGVAQEQWIDHERGAFRRQSGRVGRRASGALVNGDLSFFAHVMAGRKSCTDSCALRLHPKLA
jgi:hypothetical protein